MGKSRSAVANTLRLLNLCPDVLEKVRSGALSAGHARAVLSLKSEKQQKEAAQKIVALDLSVRQAELLCKNLDRPAPAPQRETLTVNYIGECEKQLSKQLGRGVKIVNGKHYLWLKDSGSRHGSKFYCYETQMKGCIRKYWTGRLPKDSIVIPEGGFKLNDKSPEIKKIQSFLKKKGFYKGIIGGRYGKLTRNAVKKFQAKYGLVQDGVWGPKTNAKYEEQR